MRHKEKIPEYEIKKKIIVFKYTLYFIILLEHTKQIAKNLTKSE